MKKAWYMTVWNVKRFEQRLQFSRMMRDWRPENFDMGMTEDEANKS